MNTYFKYISANFAKDFFKKQIEKLDKENVYFRKAETQDIDPKDFENEKNKYKDKMKKVEEELKIWRENHKKYYRMQPSLPTSSIYSDFCLKEIDDLTLEEAIQGYKAANEILKTIKNEDLNQYCTELKPMLNYEYKEEYKLEVERLKRLYDIPSDEEIKASLPIKTIIKTRLCLDRQKCINNSKFDLFIKEFEKNLK